jgi:His-Xaa-Ser system radical SAM maturase HxsB
MHDERGYTLLPFRFLRVPDETGDYLLVSDSGEHVFASTDQLHRLVMHELRSDEPVYSRLESRHMLAEVGRDALVFASANRLRTRLQHLRDGPALHILVATLRCDHGCPYCQVSRRVASADTTCYDMTREMASMALDRIFEANAEALTIEFQGGEPLLNPELVRFVIERAANRAAKARRSIRFVVCSTLHALTPSLLDLFRDHRVVLSTSLDGPEDLHDANRPCDGGSYRKTVAALDAARRALGSDSVSALTTLTKRSLPRITEVVDEYVRLGLHEIVLRGLSPFGFATRSARAIGYTESEFASAYRVGLEYVIELNARGTRLVEGTAALHLQKILSPFPTSYVDLRSPTGAGLGALVYNYDGGVYASDEARMLAEMGHQDFRLGDVRTPLADLLSRSGLQPLERDGVAEAQPGCNDCAFVPFCGADPIDRRASQLATQATRLASRFCQRQTAMFWTFFGLLRSATPRQMGVLLSWLRDGRGIEPSRGYVAA